MDVVFNYFSSLDQIYTLFIDKNQVLEQKRLIRPYILDKYYLEIESSVIQLIERVRLVSQNHDRLSEQELVYDIKEFFLKLFHNNLHFFISILFKE